MCAYGNWCANKIVRASMDFRSFGETTVEMAVYRQDKLCEDYTSDLIPDNFFMHGIILCAMLLRTALRHIFLVVSQEIIEY